MNGNDTIESLTAAYLEGRLSPEEAERLLETIERDEQARRTLFEMKNLYDLGRMNPLDQRQIEAGWERLVRQTSIRSGENRTAGRTSDRTPLRRMARTALRYAAVALIALSAGFAMSRYVVLHRAAGYNEVAAEAKNHSEVVLSDGTRVTLNASSRLRYPTSFDGSAREVWLDGEAYFDVEHDAKHPFDVVTPNLRVRVLGTVFSVRSLRGDHMAETTLAEGAVSLQRADGSNLIRLHPGQRAIYDTQDEQLEIKEVPVGDHLALSYGIITLDGVPLRQIADRIEELYGVKLRLVDDDAPDANYNFSFQKDTPIEDVIELLQFISGTRFEILRYPDSD